MKNKARVFLEGRELKFGNLDIVNYELEVKHKFSGAFKRFIYDIMMKDKELYVVTDHEVFELRNALVKEITRNRVSFLFESYRSLTRGEYFLEKI